MSSSEPRPSKQPGKNKRAKGRTETVNTKRAKQRKRNPLPFSDAKGGEAEAAPPFFPETLGRRHSTRGSMPAMTDTKHQNSGATLTS